jgi:hypothetical protein
MARNTGGSLLEIALRTVSGIGAVCVKIVEVELPVGVLDEDSAVDEEFDVEGDGVAFDEPVNGLWLRLW